MARLSDTDRKAMSEFYRCEEAGDYEVWCVENSHLIGKGIESALALERLFHGDGRFPSVDIVECAAVAYRGGWATYYGAEVKRIIEADRAAVIAMLHALETHLEASNG